MEITFSGSKDSSGHFKGFLTYCEENKLNPAKIKEAEMKEFMNKTLEGYPNGKPKTKSTLKTKMAAIKKHYSLNGFENINFKDLL